MAAKSYRLQRPVHLALDWDATLTVQDTIALLRDIPLQRNRRLGKELCPVPEWSSLVEAYMQDYNRHKDVEKTAAAEAGEQQQPFVEKAKGYSQMLARRRVVEEQSMKRLEEWNVFCGATHADVCQAAESVVRDGRLELREGWRELLRMFTKQHLAHDRVSPSTVSIISLNWSATFIRQCLLSTLKMEPDNDSDLARLIEHDLQIRACEIDGLRTAEGSNGQIRGNLSSADKLQHLPPTSRRTSPIYPDRHPARQMPYLVFVGDSATDFDCLMAADTGIWLCPVDDLEGAKQTCAQSFKPLELRMRPIGEANEGDLAEDELVWAQNFDQIALFLSKIAP